MNPITMNGLPQIAPLLQQQTLGLPPMDDYEESPVSSGPTSTGPTSTDLWGIDVPTPILIGLAMAVAAVPAVFALRRIYANLKIDGDQVSGFMPARGFSKAVIDSCEGSLRIFYGFEGIQKAWRAAPEDGRDDVFLKPGDGPDNVYTITRRPFGDWRIFSTYSATYEFDGDGELEQVAASRYGGILGDRTIRFAPYRELPPETPPEGKQLVTETAEIGDEAVALKVHELAQAKGEEIKIYPTVDDFRLALGKPEKVTEDKRPRWGSDEDRNKGKRLIRRSYWRGAGQPTDGETIALGESTQTGFFFTSQPERSGTAYSTGIMEVTYDMQGGRVSKLESGETYDVYQVRYNYGRDGRLLRVDIMKNKVDLGDGSSRSEVGRRTIESEALFAYRPGDVRQVRDSSAASDRAELTLNGPDRNVGTAAREIRTWLETAYQAFKDGKPETAVTLFGEISSFARSKKLEMIEVAAHVARGDMHILSGKPDFACGAYCAASDVLKGRQHQELSNAIDALSAETSGVGGKEIVQDIWNEMHPKDWLFFDPLAKLEGGVASEGLEDAVPLPEVLQAKSAAWRMETLTTRREILDAFRARKQLRDVGERVEKK